MAGRLIRFNSQRGVWAGRTAFNFLFHRELCLHPDVFRLGGPEKYSSPGDGTQNALGSSPHQAQTFCAPYFCPYGVLPYQREMEGFRHSSNIRFCRSFLSDFSRDDLPHEPLREDLKIVACELRRTYPNGRCLAQRKNDTCR
eukprot:TRINITY_DN16775_c0_g1_i2.p1 TRINITY_DN16775_c0_g1~~TRINITY_DN16775_c0_g1_i2.p1  ORF type:complete len:142 (+),score=2.38 TRINITY_DN16775_c0_g1_i2:360-785(+)